MKQGASPSPLFRVNLQVACRSVEAPRTGDSQRLRIDSLALRRRMEFTLSLVSDFPTSFNIRLCDREEMQQMNASFRGKDKPTDVLSFPATPGFSDTAVRGRVLYSLGDVLVCVPVCAAQARTHRVTLGRELEKMLIHGLVHLKGFDHERSDAAWRAMSSLEKALAKELNAAFGVPDFVRLD